MIRKRKGGSRKKRSTRKRQPRLTTEYNILTVITIGTGNAIPDPAALECLPGAPAVWILVNQDTDMHVVSIDFKKIKHTDNGKMEHPFLKDDVLSVSLDPGEAGVFFAVTRTGLTNEHYKYTIDSSDRTGGVSRDPDLDVVDPNSVPE
jgi:hypothetical protein